MPDPARALLVYAKLAALAWQKQQWAGRDRFLVLAGAAACRGGWLDVAERCRALILQHNRRHRIGRHAHFAEALRDPDFRPFLRQQERFCGYERAEHLLRELEIDPDLPAGSSETDVGAYALSLLEPAERH